MTALSLFLWICLGIAVQLVVYLSISFWSNRIKYKVFFGSIQKKTSIQLNTESTLQTQTTTGGAWTGFKTFIVDRKIVENSEESICSFYLAPNDGEPLRHFLPGQFLIFRLQVPTKSGDLEQTIRCYSLSDAPNTDYYRVTIKRLPMSLGSDRTAGRSSNYFHDHVTVGSILEFRAPTGNFHIDKSNCPVILVAGGIGITPLLSMLNWSLANQADREIWLFYGARNGREIIMASHLEALALNHKNFHLKFCFSKPLPEDAHAFRAFHTGRVEYRLFPTQSPSEPFHFYICGPATMIQELVTELENHKVPQAQIHFEAFGPASIQRQEKQSLVTKAINATKGSGIVVNFINSDKELSWSPTANNLLEFAELNNIPIHSGCRSGSCGSCQTRVLSGEIEYSQSPNFDPEPGTCLPCVCRPKTNVTIEA